MKAAQLLPSKTSPARVLETSITYAGRIVPKSPRSAELGLLTIGSATAYVSINAELSHTGSEQLILATASDTYFGTGSNGEDIFDPAPGPLAYGDSGSGSPGSDENENGDKSDNHSHQRRGMTIGITLGVVGACIICGIVIFLVASRRRRKFKPLQNGTAASSQSSLEFQCAGEQLN
ncbi:hypothetical protein HJFPF1_13585 [Paramyrothecium foliicola]|nr:hypothetical protein HJFPF1_13585 [Paramyrothecium foliicola]